MDEASKGQGWWLAADGKYYPPEQHPGVELVAPSVGADSAAVRTPSKGLVVFVGLAVALFMAYAAVGGTRLMQSSGSGGVEWSEADQAQFATGCVAQSAAGLSDLAVTPSSCACWAEKLQDAGLTADDMRALDEDDPGANERKVEKAAAKCSIGVER